MKPTDKLSTQDITQIGLMTAAIAVLAQISIPMPAGVPMTMQTFAVPLAGILLGAKKGTFATVAYLLLGAVGVPVCSPFPLCPGLREKGKKKRACPG